MMAFRSRDLDGRLFKASAMAAGRSMVIRVLLVGMAFAIASTLSGCAHPIVITPDIGRLDGQLISSAKVPAKVGLVVPSDRLSAEVITPGGGGDKVSYFPYRDLDAAYMRVLMSVFSEVRRLDGAGAAANADVRYVLTPQVSTNSWSDGLFTWPPTDFTVEITTVITDRSGRTVAEPRAVGTGRVGSLTEFGGDFGLAGRRAMEEALVKTQRSLIEAANDITARSPGHTAESPDGIAAQLRALQDMFDKGLITEAEYKAKRADLLRRL